MDVSWLGNRNRRPRGFGSMAQLFIHSFDVYSQSGVGLFVGDLRPGNIYGHIRTGIDV